MSDVTRGAECAASDACASMAAPKPCPFCSLSASQVIASSDHALAFRDSYPVTEGHTLVIPKRHLASIFEMTDEELSDFWRFVGEMRTRILEEFGCDGINVGVNDGRAAGQTVMHGHLHLIPRRSGDVADPRGGVRWIMPEKAVYWKNDT